MKIATWTTSKTAAYLSALILAAAMPGCKTSRPDGSELRAVTTLGPDEAIDLTTYSANGEDCERIPASDEGFAAASRKEVNPTKNLGEASEDGLEPMPEISPEAVAKFPKLELAAIVDYTEGGYKAQNRAMRLQNLLQLDQLKAKVRCTASGLNKLPVVAAAVSRWAHLEPDELAAYVPQSVVVMHTFVSAALGDVDKIKSVAPFCSDIKYNIHATKGHAVAWLSSRSQEREVVFSPGSEFRVLSVVQEASPFAADDPDFGRCAEKVPRRTVITLAQVPSGTFKAENPGIPESLPITRLDTEADLQGYLNDPRLAGHSGQLTAIFLKRRAPQLASEVDLKMLLSKVTALCKKYKGDSASKRDWSEAFLIPSCTPKVLRIGSPVTFAGLPVQAGTALAFYPDGRVSTAELSKPATIEGILVSGAVSFDEQGRLMTFIYQGGLPLQLDGQPMKLPGGTQTMVSEGKVVTSIKLPKAVPTLMIRGILATEVAFDESGVLTEITSASPGSIPFTAFSGDETTISYYESGVVKRIAAKAFKLSDKRFQAAEDSIEFITFHGDGKIAALRMREENTIMFRGVAYRQLAFRPDGAIGAFSPVDPLVAPRLPCAQEESRDNLVYLNAKGEVTACDKYASDFTWAGQTYKAGRRFAISDSGEVLDVTLARSWGTFKSDHGVLN